MVCARCMNKIPMHNTTREASDDDANGVDKAPSRAHRGGEIHLQTAPPALHRFYPRMQISRAPFTSKQTPSWLF